MLTDYVIIPLYFIVLILLSTMGLHRYQILYLYYKHRKDVPQPTSQFTDLPKITVQLPIFNEMHVAARAIDCACAIDYPKDRLEIQVLDDSTDKTTNICREQVAHYQAQGFDIKLLHRENREGFKAGALQAAIAQTDSDFFAIFDADFMPEPSVLKNMIHHFTAPDVGMVQARWSHANREFSTLTQVQSIFLDGHVVLEQPARNRSGRFMNFDGTAGMWRRQAINDGGGWEGDTLGEDVDLSYRSQMAGWRFVFLKDLPCAAEVPVEMTAFKIQQQRWIKGHCQIALKLLGDLVRSPKVTFTQKVEACFHLLAIYAYPLVVVLMLLMLPMVSIRTSNHEYIWLWFDLPVFLAATSSVWTFYMTGQREEGGQWQKRLPFIPLLISVGTAISVSNTKAIIDVYRGRAGGFVRTPKYGMVGGQQKNNWQRMSYELRDLYLPVIELAFAVYLSVAFVIGVMNARWLSLPFLGLFTIGFYYMGILSVWQPIQRALIRRRDRKSAPSLALSAQSAESDR